jgi:hypothetical protein
MKKLFTLVLLFCSLFSLAQMTLVKETGQDLRPFLLSNGKWMLYSGIYSSNSNNPKLKSITFYNTDFSVFKLVDISQSFPFDTVGFPNNYIRLESIEVLGENNGTDFEFTEGFFNNDNKIEFIIKYISYKSENSKMYWKETDYILNEDGLELQKFENLKGQIQFNFWKYLNITFDNSVENYKVFNTKIYSVPGNLPCPFTCGQKAASIAPITQPNEFKEIQVTGFPNPSSEKVTLAYSLPEGTQFGTLRLYTQTGELVKEFKVSNQVDHLELPVSEYNSGTYFYELQAGGSSSGGKKMVVIH